MTDQPQKNHLERIYIVGVVAGMLIMALEALSLPFMANILVTLLILVIGYFAARFINWLQF